LRKTPGRCADGDGVCAATVLLGSLPRSAETNLNPAERSCAEGGYAHAGRRPAYGWHGGLTNRFALLPLAQWGGTPAAALGRTEEPSSSGDARAFMGTPPTTCSRRTWG